MSSIIGYIGKGLSCGIVLDALKRLEYRGYDCSGFACLGLQNNQILYAKTTETLLELHQACTSSGIDGRVGLGHLRLASHGIISQENTHPQFDCHNAIAVAHNGVIENSHLLRKRLEEAGHIFLSSVEGEVVAHLLEASLQSHETFKAAIIDAIKEIEGTYAFVAILQDKPDCLVLVRKRSPLYIGISDGQVMAASGLCAFNDFTNKIGFMPDESIAFVTPSMIELYDFSGNALPLHTQDLSFNDHKHEMCGYDHFMLKEIYEQKKAISDTLEFLKMVSHNIWEHVGISAEQVCNIERIHLIGSGSSWHAARIAQFFFEHIAHIPVQVSLASEFCFMPLLSADKTLFLLLSQSGETPDILSALRLIANTQLPTIGVTNTPSSTLVREASGFLLTQAGHERAVASTKSFTAQLAALYWFAHRVALEKNIIDESMMQAAEADLLVAAEVLENSIDNYKLDIERNLAQDYARYHNIMFLGRHISYPFALEAALKLKKISYLSVECYPAGELKHGPVVGIDASCPIFLFSHPDPIIYQKLLNNAREIKARGGHLVSFMFEGQKELQALSDQAFVISPVNPLLAPIAMTGLMQFLMYQIAKKLCCPIDKPRYIGKACDY